MTAGAAALVDAAAGRMARGSSFTLASLRDPRSTAALAEPDGCMLAAVGELTGADRAWLRARTPELAAAFADCFTRWALDRNQFLAIDASAQARARRVYTLGLDRLLILSERARDDALGGRVRLVLQEHGAALHSLLDDASTGPLDDAVSAEYAPATQLRVLGLTPVRMQGPVLDVGCGARGSLAGHLRASGLEVVAIDRRTSLEIEADWLAFEPGFGRWGTIVSHHAFSLHFLRQHRLGPRSVATAYASAYLGYLEGLKPGGTFAYAPSLPFIEALLPPERWAVDSSEAVIEGVRTSATRVSRRLR